MLKKITFVLGTCFVFVLCANEFTMPKKIVRRTSASKIKENILSEIGDTLKNLIDLDGLSLQIRSLMQNQFEMGLLGDKGSNVSSSNKVELGEYLAVIKDVNEGLLLQIKKLEDKLKILQQKSKARRKS